MLVIASTTACFRGPRCENPDSHNKGVAKMKHKKFINWLSLSAVLGLIVYTLHDVIGAMYYPGYDWMSQAVSDLTAQNAPSFVVAKGLSSVYALLACITSVVVCLLIQGKGHRAFRLGVYLFAIMNWISAIGYALFPLSSSGYAGTFQDVMHVYVVTVLVVLLSIVSLVSIILGGFKDSRRYRSLSIWACAALTCMLIGPIGMAVVPSNYFGIVERFSVYSAVFFNAILGLYGFASFERIDAIQVTPKGI